MAFQELQLPRFVFIKTSDLSNLNYGFMHHSNYWTIASTMSNERSSTLSRFFFIGFQKLENNKKWNYSYHGMTLEFLGLLVQDKILRRENNQFAKCIKYAGFKLEKNHCQL